MGPLVFVTGNGNKVKDVEVQLGIPIEHHALDLYEVQSMDLHEVLEAKAREAYQHLKRPVIVDDTSLIYEELNGLPGPFIKWFLKSMGNEGLCKLADLTTTRKAIARVGIGYCNGDTFKAFISEKNGTITDSPRGTGGYGWDVIFVQEGHTMTHAELTEEEYRASSIRQGALDALKSYLKG